VRGLGSVGVSGQLTGLGMGRLSGRANLAPHYVRGLVVLFWVFPTPSGPGWQDAWAMGRCWREEAH
jgi:hypothetical protein